MMMRAVRRGISFDYYSGTTKGRGAEKKTLSYSILPLLLQSIELRSILCKLRPEILDALVRFLLFRGYYLLFRELVVVVYCAREGG